MRVTSYKRQLAWVYGQEISQVFGIALRIIRSQFERLMNSSQDKSPGSVTLLLVGLCNVDETKTKQFWKIFFPRLVRVANKILRDYQAAEDTAQEALVKFWIEAKQDKIPSDMNRFGIWAFLSQITTRQALDFVKYRQRKKRGEGKVVAESDLAATAGIEDWNLDAMIGDLNYYAFDMVVYELLGALPRKVRAILVWKMMGYSNQEIADILDCSEKTVRRKIGQIRKHLQAKRALEP